MTYYKDLSKSKYSSDEEEMLSVGFLDAMHGFKKSPLPTDMLCVIEELIKKPYIQHRGYHYCEICKPPEEVSSNNDSLASWNSLRCGDSIIQVKGATGVVYVAPSLIVHYIAEHQYCPPTGFLEALVGKRMRDYIEEFNKRFGRRKNFEGFVE